MHHLFLYTALCILLFLAMKGNCDILPIYGLYANCLQLIKNKTLHFFQLLKNIVIAYKTRGAGGNGGCYSPTASCISITICRTFFTKNFFISFQSGLSFPQYCGSGSISALPNNVV